MVIKICARRLLSRSWTIILKKCPRHHSSMWWTCLFSWVHTKSAWWISKVWFPYGGAGVAQWWERSPPTNVARVRFRPGAICGLSLLLVLVPAPRVFLRVFRFSSLHKNQHSKFQFDLGCTYTSLRAPELFCVTWVNKLQLHFFMFAGLWRHQPMQLQWPQQLTI